MIILNVVALCIIGLFSFHFLVTILHFITKTLTGFITNTFINYIKILVIAVFIGLVYMYSSNINNLLIDNFNISIDNNLNFSNMNISQYYDSLYDTVSNYTKNISLQLNLSSVRDNIL